MTLEEMRKVVSKIEYKNWTIQVQLDRHLYLQVQWMDTHFVEGHITMQRGRKWLLSEYMTKSELVQTAFKAILTAEEHEVREQFRYKGARIFSPHFDVDALVKLATPKSNFDIRVERPVA